MAASIAWIYCDLFFHVHGPQFLSGFNIYETRLMTKWQWYFTSNVTQNINCLRFYNKNCSKSILHSRTVATKRHKLNLGSTVITWSAIGYWFSFSATSVTCDILSFKTSHFIATTKHLWCDSLWEIPLYRTSRELTMFWKDFLKFLSWIKTHPIQTSHLILLTDFCIIFKSVCGSIVSTVTWICTGSSWVQILAGA